jgi:hypothetical protein
VRIVVEEWAGAKDRPLTMLIAEEQTCQPLSQLFGDLT